MGRQPVIGLIEVAAGLMFMVTMSACGGGTVTPASTSSDGLPVYDPEHTVLELTAGPRIIIEMPRPQTGAMWRLFNAPDNMGGVSLRGMQHADGSGRWTFETIGPGAGTLDFQQWSPGSDEPSDTVTYEVNVK